MIPTGPMPPCIPLKEKTPTVVADQELFIQLIGVFTTVLTVVLTIKPRGPFGPSIPTEPRSPGGPCI